MDELISRQAAIDACMREDVINGYDVACLIAQLPTAEKKGKWVCFANEGGELDLRCSACGGRVIYSAYTSAVGTRGYAYCPYCGARMEESDG